MKVIHIQNNLEGYEIVELIANKVNKDNHLSVIKKNGELFFTGGIILKNSIIIRNILDDFLDYEQYGVAKLFLHKPLVKKYFED